MERIPRGDDVDRRELDCVADVDRRVTTPFHRRADGRPMRELLATAGVDTSELPAAEQALALIGPD